MSCNIDSIDMLMIFFIRKIKLSHYINDTMQQKIFFSTFQQNILIQIILSDYIINLSYFLSWKFNRAQNYDLRTIEALSPDNKFKFQNSTLNVEIIFRHFQNRIHITCQKNNQFHKFRPIFRDSTCLDKPN